MLPSTGRSEYISLQPYACMVEYHVCTSRNIKLQSFPVMPQGLRPALSRRLHHAMQPNADMRACEIVKWAQDDTYCSSWPLFLSKMGKKATEGVHRKLLLHPDEAGCREGVAAPSIFFPSSACCSVRCQRQTKLAEPQIRARPAEKAVETFFPWKICTRVFYPRSSEFHTYADDTLLLSTLSVKYSIIISMALFGWLKKARRWS